MMGPLCSISIYGSPVTLINFQMAPRLTLLMSSGSEKRGGADTHVWVKSKLHTHRECGQRFHPLLHTYTVDCLTAQLDEDVFRVLCPVRRPVTALDCVLLKDRNPALAPRQGPEINSQACLRVLPRTRHHTQCWLTNQHLVLFLISCLQNPKASSGPTNFRAEPSLANSLMISFPRTPTGTQ